MQLGDVKMCNECRHFYMQITYQYLLTTYFRAQMSVPLKFLQIVIVLYYSNSMDMYVFTTINFSVC
jgi:hypothetical protein